jgi:hypothetical protein
MRRTTRAEEARNWLTEWRNEATAQFTLLVSRVASSLDNRVGTDWRKSRMILEGSSFVADATDIFFKIVELAMRVIDESKYEFLDPALI